MFAENPSKGDAKLFAMYKEMNTRLASALMDHDWAQNLNKLSMTANPYFRPFM